jgi:hypothetical protein
MLKTSDEYFDYSRDGIPPQGRWRISGLDLGPETLASVYFENARRIIA